MFKTGITDYLHPNIHLKLVIGKNAEKFNLIKK